MHHQYHPVKHPTVAPAQEHIEEKTIVEVSASVPGYKIGFFVSHETVKDSPKTNSPRLDKTTQKAID